MCLLGEWFSGMLWGPPSSCCTEGVIQGLTTFLLTSRTGLGTESRHLRCPQAWIRPHYLPDREHGRVSFLACWPETPRFWVWLGTPGHPLESRVKIGPSPDVLPASHKLSESSRWKSWRQPQRGLTLRNPAQTQIRCTRLAELLWKLDSGIRFSKGHISGSHLPHSSKL